MGGAIGVCVMMKVNEEMRMARRVRMRVRVKGMVGVGVDHP
jgi:allophanate hydrolase subunit 1